MAERLYSAFVSRTGQAENFSFAYAVTASGLNGSVRMRRFDERRRAERLNVSPRKAEHRQGSGPSDRTASQRRKMKVRLGILYVLGYVSLYVVYGHLRSDLYAPWYGSQVVMKHQSPYTSDVTRQIQMLYYGRPLLRGDEQRFAYPAYVSLLLLPVLIFPFQVAQLLMIIFLVLSMCVLVRLSMSMVEAAASPDPPLSNSAIMFLALISPPVLCGLLLQQVALLVELLIIAALWTVVRRSYLGAGLLLALATSKPQLALVPVIWLMVWSLGNWRERWKLPSSFIVSSSLLVAYAAFFAGPTWVLQWLKGLVAYRGYAHGAVSVLELISGTRLGPIVSALAFLGLLLYMIVHRKERPDSFNFLKVSFLLLSLSLLVIPTLLSLFNYVLLIPGILLILTTHRPPRLAAIENQNLTGG